MTDGRASPARRRAGAEIRAFLELLALCGFAIAQPLLDVFGNAPEEFVFRGASRFDIVAFALVLSLAPALVLWGVEAAVGVVDATARRWLHVGFLAALLAIFVLQLLKEASGLRGVPLAVVAALAGVGFGVLYLKVTGARVWLAFAAGGSAVFLVLFLVFSPVADLLDTGEVAAAELEGIENPAPVVVLVFDELPTATLVDATGALAADLYPNLARLAGISTWYRNATTVSSQTWHAMPSLLTGDYPVDGTVPIAADHPESLFTLLGGAYDLHVTESITRICPDNLCESTTGSEHTGGLRATLGDAWDVWRDQVSLDDPATDPTAGFVESVAGEPAITDDAPATAPDGRALDFGDYEANQPARFDTFLAGLGSSEGDAPTLDYLHVLLPHEPWRYLPSGQTYDHPDVVPGKVDDRWVDETWPVDLARQRHLLQMRYTDALVGVLLDRLDELGVLDEALIVVTADHGVAFRPGELVRGVDTDELAEEILPEIAWVPLFVKAPGQTAGEVSDANVELIDVVPTVADLLGVELPWDVDGISLVEQPEGRRTDDKVFYQSRTGIGIVGAGNRYEVDGPSGLAEAFARGTDALLAADPADPLRSYRVGSRPELVGRPVADLERGPTTSLTASLDVGALAAVDTAAATLPVFVSGRLEGVDGASPTVAVAVNGRIAAVAPTFGWEGADHTVAALVPPDLLVAGANDVELFVLDGNELLPVELR